METQVCHRSPPVPKIKFHQIRSSEGSGRPRSLSQTVSPPPFLTQTRIQFSPRSTPTITKNRDGLTKYDIKISKFSEKRVNSLNKVRFLSETTLLATYKKIGHLIFYNLDQEKKIKEEKFCELVKEPKLFATYDYWVVMVYPGNNSSYDILYVVISDGTLKELKLSFFVLYLVAQESGIYLITQDKLYLVSDYEDMKINKTIDLEIPLTETKIYHELSVFRDEMLLLVSPNGREFSLINLNNGKSLCSTKSLENHILVIDFNRTHVVGIVLGDIFICDLSNGNFRKLKTGDVKPVSLLIYNDIFLVGCVNGTVDLYKLKNLEQKPVCILGHMEENTSLHSPRGLNLDECVYKMYLLDDENVAVFQKSCIILCNLNNNFAPAAMLKWKGKGTNFSLFYRYQESKQNNTNSEIKQMGSGLFLVGYDRRTTYFDALKPNENDIEKIPKIPIVCFKITNSDGSEQFCVWKPPLKRIQKEKTLGVAKTKRNSMGNVKIDLNMKSRSRNNSVTINDSIVMKTHRKLTPRSPGREKQENLVRSRSQEEMKFLHEFRRFASKHYNIESEHYYHIRRQRVTPEIGCTLPPLDKENYTIQDIFSNDTLFYYFEIYLKEKNNENFLYYIMDTGDFLNCHYTNPNVKDKCCLFISKLWLGEDSPLKNIILEKKISNNENNVMVVIEQLYEYSERFLQSKWDDFRKWYLEYQKTLTNSKSNKKKKFKYSFNSLEKKFSKLLDDEILYSEFESYLKSRNASQYLYFMDEYNFFKTFIPNSDHDIFDEAEQISQLYFFGEDKSTVIHTNSNNLSTLKNDLSIKSKNIKLSFDHIYGDVMWVLKTLYWDFCYEKKLKHPSIKNFNDVYINPEKHQFYQKCQELQLHGYLKFCAAVTKLKNSTLKESKKAKIPTENILTLLKEVSVVYLEEQESLEKLKYTKRSEMQRVRTMVNEGIFTINMFDKLFDHVQKRLVMYYVDLACEQN